MVNSVPFSEYFIALLGWIDFRFFLVLQAFPGKITILPIINFCKSEVTIGDKGQIKTAKANAHLVDN